MMLKTLSNKFGWSNQRQSLYSLYTGVTTASYYVVTDKMATNQNREVAIKRQQQWLYTNNPSEILLLNTSKCNAWYETLGYK